MIRSPATPATVSTARRSATGRLSMAVVSRSPRTSGMTAWTTLTDSTVADPVGMCTRRGYPGVGGSGALLLCLLARGVGGESGDEGLLGHLDPADHLHPLLALLLLLQQLALAGDVTAVALGEHVLADRPDVLAGDDSRPDRCLDRHLELLPRDQLAQSLGHLHAVAVGLVLVHDRGERVDGLALKQDVHLDQVGRLLAVDLVVERRVAPRLGLQVVEKVEDDLGQGQGVSQLD